MLDTELEYDEQSEELARIASHTVFQTRQYYSAIALFLPRQLVS
jgi:hypothetical protein